ncbi:hypothetical protein AAVH_12607 [Aphelenchoides avenae]|nr:hypothetical protein AAVH_12607 [Aphelenchus avenae]
MFNVFLEHDHLTDRGKPSGFDRRPEEDHSLQALIDDRDSIICAASAAAPRGFKALERTRLCNVNDPSGGIAARAQSEGAISGRKQFAVASDEPRRARPLSTGFTARRIIDSDRERTN